MKRRGKEEGGKERPLCPGWRLRRQEKGKEDLNICKGLRRRGDILCRDFTSKDHNKKKRYMIACTSRVEAKLQTTGEMVSRSYGEGGRRNKTCSLEKGEEERKPRGDKHRPDLEREERQTCGRPHVH